MKVSRVACTAALVGALALALPTAASAETVEAGDKCKRSEVGQTVEVDGTVLECQKTGRAQWTWVDVTPEGEEEEQEEGADEGAPSEVVFTDTCDGVSGEIHFGDRDAAYRYSTWIDGEPSAEDAAGEPEAVKPWDPVEAGELRVLVEYEGESEWHTDLDETHSHTAPEDEECGSGGEDAGSGDEGGEDAGAECANVVACVQKLVDDGVIKAGDQVVIVVNGVEYLCLIDEDGEVSYEEVEYTEEDCEEDDVRYLRYADGVWSEWVDCSEWAPVGDDEAAGKPTPADADETGVPEAEEAAAGGLPVTGGALAGLVAAAVAALGGGGAAMWAARRRKAPAEG